MDDSFSKSDRVFYILSLITLGGFVLVAVLQHAGIFKLTYNIQYPCGFRYFTGLYCPGCGASHSLTSLIDFHIIDSILYNPFVPYVFLCAIVYAFVNTIALIRKKNYLGFRMLYVYVGIGILLGQCVIKNIMLLF